MMEKDLVDIIRDKEYIELSAEEKRELMEFCASESEYNQMKEVFKSVETMEFEMPTPRKETKESLDQLFEQTYRTGSPIWYMSILSVVVPKEKPVYRQPLVQVSALALLFLLVYPMVGNEIINEKPVLAKVEQQAGTKTEVEELKLEEKELKKVDIEVVEKETPVEFEEKLVTPLKEEEEVMQGALSFDPHATSFNVQSTQTESVPLTNSTRNDLTFSFSKPGKDHPDGVFKGGLALSQPASDEPEYLDLLTASF